MLHLGLAARAQHEHGAECCVGQGPCLVGHPLEQHFDRGLLQQLAGQHPDALETLQVALAPDRVPRLAEALAHERAVPL